MIPIAIYTAPNWKHFYTSNWVTIIGWGEKRLVIAWWMLKLLKDKRLRGQ